MSDVNQQDPVKIASQAMEGMAGEIVKTQDKLVNVEKTLSEFMEFQKSEKVVALEKQAEALKAKEAELDKKEHEAMIKSARKQTIAESQFPATSNSYIDSQTMELVKSEIHGGHGAKTILKQELADKIIHLTKSQPTVDALRTDFGVNGGYVVQNQISALENITIGSSIMQLTKLPTMITLPARNVKSIRPKLVGNYRSPLQRRRLMEDAIINPKRLSHSAKAISVQSFYETEIMDRDMPQGTLEASMREILRAKDYITATSMLKKDAYGYSSIESIFDHASIIKEDTLTAKKIVYTDLSRMFANIPTEISQASGFAVVMPITVANTLALEETGLDMRKNSDVLQFINGQLTIKLCGIPIRCILTDVEDVFGELVPDTQDPKSPEFTSGKDCVLMGDFTRGYTLAEAPTPNPLVYNTPDQQVLKDMLQMTMEFNIGGIVERPELFRVLVIK